MRLPARRLNLSRTAVAAVGLLFPAHAVSQSLPERPALPIDVVSTVGRRPLHGHISAERSTQDGRVRLSRNGLHTGRPEVFSIDLFGECRGICRIESAGDAGFLDVGFLLAFRGSGLRVSRAGKVRDEDQA